MKLTKSQLNQMIQEELTKMLNEQSYSAQGETAGQTVMHLHIHLIPRRKGDIEDPRGGVRGVIPDKQSY